MKSDQTSSQPKLKDLRETLDSRRSKSSNRTVGNRSTGNEKYSKEKEKEKEKPQNLASSSRPNFRNDRQGSKVHGRHKIGETFSRQQLSGDASSKPGRFSSTKRPRQSASKAVEARSKRERRKSSHDNKSDRCSTKTPPRSKPSCKGKPKKWQRSQRNQNETSKRKESRDLTDNSSKDSRKRKHAPSTETHKPNKKPYKKINPFIHYNDRLARLLLKDSSEIIIALLDDYEAFCEFLKGENLSAKSMEEILEILSKLYDTPYTQNFMKIFAVFQDEAFLKHLRRYILKLQYLPENDREKKKTDLERIIQLFNELLRRFPDKCEDLPLDVLFTYADQCIATTNDDNSGSNTNHKDNKNDSESSNDNISSQSENTSANENQGQHIKASILGLKSLRDELLKRKHSPANISVVKNTPPDDYKSIPVFPRAEDIFPDKPPFLRKNIVCGRYVDVTHYLDVQFRLLREDYIAPIRDGVIEVTGTHGDQTQSIYVYRNVKVVGRFLDTKYGGLLHRVQFEVNRMRRVNWENTKRFKYGSLFCLIDSNNTSTMYFVTITERNPEKLRKGILNVKLFDDNLVETINHEQQFFMIESPAYFESYRHVLEGLQNFNKDNLPFQRYLVECRSDVNPPVYLTKSANPVLGLKEDDHLEVKDGHKKSRHGCYDLTEALSCKEAMSVQVVSPDSWPSLSHVDLNESQYNALKAAITQEFVVIQGPPGTGKTFIGLRIANALLVNKSIWHGRKALTENEKKIDRTKSTQSHSPILVVCYTNHALDQFLEGILKITDNIARVGGRGKSESLERFNLKARKRLTKQSLHCRNLKNELKSIQAKIEDERKIIEKAEKELHPKDLVTILGNEEQEQLEQWRRVAAQMRVHRIEAWLKMQDECYDDSRNKRKRSSGESDEKKCNTSDITAKRSRNTSDSTTNQNQHRDALNPSSIQQTNLMCLSEEDVEEKIDGLNELEEGELPESDDEVFRQNGDTYKSHTITSKDSEEINGTTNLTTADKNSNNCQIMDECFLNLIPSEENDINPAKATVSETAEENKNIQNNKDSIMVIDEQSNNEQDQEKRNASLISSLQKISEMDNDSGDSKNLNERDDIPEARNSDQPNDVVNEDAEEGEIFDTDDDDASSGDDDISGAAIDLTAIIERDIGVFKSLGNNKETVDQIPGVGDATFAESQNKNSQQTYQLDLKVLSEDQRSDLYHQWEKRYFKYHRDRIKRLRKTHDEKLQQLSEIESIQMEGILKNVDVIGMTTTGAAKHRRTLQEIKPRIVIVEEAAEVLEGHVITALSSGTDHLILIGDHKQLKPNPAVYELARKYNLDVSLFERMVMNGLTCHSLNTQHRMRPEISGIMRLIYPNLVDDTSVQRYESITGVQHNVYFIDHQHPESGNEELKSHSNEHEVDFVAALCHYLLLQGYRGNSITVLTMYTGQLLKLQRCMPKDPFDGIRISSVDNFQGEESDIIILSLVRSNKDGKIGFLNIPNRVCVALSRAKKAMYCIGNITMMAETNKLWNKIKNHLHQNSMIGTSLLLCCPKHPEKKIDAASAEDFKKAPQGGCMSLCGFRLLCGHACPLHCHPVDPKHETYRCIEKCLEELCDLKHRCRKQCHFGEDCEPCEEKVSYVFPLCKHEIKIECHKRGKTPCPIPCTKKLPCSHPCAGKCGEECKTISCQTEVSRTLNCGHTVTMPCSTDAKCYECAEPCEKILDCGHKCPGNCSKCYKGTFHVKCKQQCKRLLVCSHECEQPCTKYCPPCKRPCENRCNHSYCPRSCGMPCTPCGMLCMWKCKHHKCTKRCGEMCDRKKCNEPCSKPLKCGHQCVGICGDFCPRLCRICDQEELQTIFLGNEDEPGALYIELVDCKHVFEVNDLDYWMEGIQDSETDLAVQLKVCPRCKTPIRRSLRYGNIVKKTLADIENVKKIKLEEQRQLKQKRFELEERIDKLVEKHPKVVKYGVDRLRVHRLADDPDAYTTLDNQLQFFSRLCEIDEMFFKRPEMANFVTRASELVRKKRQICKHLQQKTLLTDQEVKDISKNIAFLTLCCQFECMLWKIDKDDKNSVLTEEIKASIESAKEILSRQGNAINTPLAVTDDEQAIVASVIEKVSKELEVLRLTPKERDDINKALKLRKGHWFKCRNGHLYIITECGGAMQKRKCPDCDEMIGGSNHKLAEGNQLAPEMDGAKHPAWSNQTNLLNYDPNELRRLQR